MQKGCCLDLLLGRQRALLNLISHLGVKEVRDGTCREEQTEQVILN